MTDLTFVTIDEMVDEIEKRATIFAMVIVPKAQPPLEDGTLDYKTFYGYDDGHGQNAMVAMFRLGKAVCDFVVDNSRQEEAE